jgi:preprotein translocase subunit YajC
MNRLILFFALLVSQFGILNPVYTFAPPPGSGQQDPTMSLFLMIGVFLFIFYFIVMRPQQKEQKRHRERVESLKKGDRVVTAGGIHGTVRTPKDKTVILEIADGVKITVNKTAVTTVLDETESKSKSAKSADEDEEDESE